MFDNTEKTIDDLSFYLVNRLDGKEWTKKAEKYYYDRLDKSYEDAKKETIQLLCSDLFEYVGQKFLSSEQNGNDFLIGYMEIFFEHLQKGVFETVARFYFLGVNKTWVKK